VKRKLKSLQLPFERRKRYWKPEKVVEVQRRLRNEFGKPPRTWANTTKSRGTSRLMEWLRGANAEDVAARLTVKVL
jgi:hypothetical protein